MYGTQISSLSLSKALLEASQKNKDAYSTSQLKLSSGEKYLSRSENPLETSQAQGIENEISKTSLWVDNVEMAESWETATDSALQEIVDAMNDASSLIVEMNSGTLDSDDYESIATEVNSLLKSLVSLGNTKYLGKELFAGVSTGSNPFETLPAGEEDNITSVTFLDGATTSKRSISTSSSSTSEYGILGDSIFTFTHQENTGTEESPVWEDVSVNIFDTLISIRDSLKSGELPSTTLCERITAGLDNVALKEVECASSQQKFTSISTLLSSVAKSETTRLSEVANLDMAEETINLSNYEAALEASYQVLAGANSLSLLNYI